jgi:hypothetical protein
LPDDLVKKPFVCRRRRIGRVAGGEGPLAVIRDPARNEPMIVVARENDAYRAFWTIDGVFQGRGGIPTQVG